MRLKNPPHLIKLILQEEGLDLLDKHVLKAVVSDLLLGVAEIKFCKDSWKDTVFPKSKYKNV